MLVRLRFDWGLTYKASVAMSAAEGRAADVSSNLGAILRAPKRPSWMIPRVSNVYFPIILASSAADRTRNPEFGSSTHCEAISRGQQDNGH